MRHKTQTEEAEGEGDVERLRGQSQIEWMSVEEHLSLSLPRSVVSGGVAEGSGTRGTGGVEFPVVVGGEAIRGPFRVPGNSRHPQLLHPPAGKRTESLHSLLLIHPLGVLVVDLLWEGEGEDGEGKRKVNLKTFVFLHYLWLFSDSPSSLTLLLREERFLLPLFALLERRKPFLG